MNRREEATDYTTLRPLTITIRCDVCGEEWRPHAPFHFEDVCLCGLQDVKDHLEATTNG